MSSSDNEKRRLSWRGVEELAIELIVFGGPAYFLSSFLMTLTGGALWLPTEWRKVLLALGLAGGLALFHLARIQVQRRFPPADRISPSQRPKKVRKARRAAEEDKLDAATFAQKRVLGWLAVTVVAVCLHTTLRMNTVHAWSPPDDMARGLFTDDPDPRSPDPTFTIDTRRIAPPVFLEPEGPPWNGSFLFPIGFPWTVAGEEFERQVRDVYTAGNERSIREEALQHRASDLIDLIRDDERMALNVTVITFVLVHLLVLGLASIAYGYGFSLVEEVVGGIPQLLG